MKENFYAKLSIGVACALLLTGCGQEKPQVLPEPTPEIVLEQTVDTSKTNELAQDTALSNPATVYCLQEGGEFIMKKTLDGATEGFCVLPNNITCEVWAHYQGDCPTKQQKVEEDDQAENEEADTGETEPESADFALSADSDQDSIEATEEAVQQEEGTSDKQDPIETDDELELTVEPGEEPGELVNSWKTNGLKAPDGFYVMLSGEEKIEYPAKYSHELKNSASRSFVWTGLTAGKTYYFRVCVIAQGVCEYYSPVVSGTVQ